MKTPIHLWLNSLLRTTISCFLCFLFIFCFLSVLSPLLGKSGKASPSNHPKETIVEESSGDKDEEAGSVEDVEGIREPEAKSDEGLVSEEPIGNENVDSGGLPNSSEKEDSVNHSEETIVEESSGDKEEATDSVEVAERKSEPEAKTDESIVAEEPESFTPEEQTADNNPQENTSHSPHSQVTDVDTANLLAQIEKNNLPEGYQGRYHQAYVDYVMDGLNAKKRSRIGQLWEEKRRIDPDMPNRGASFVKILTYVAGELTAEEITDLMELTKSPEKEDSFTHDEETIVDESAGGKDEVAESVEVGESKSTSEEILHEYPLADQSRNSDLLNENDSPKLDRESENKDFEVVDRDERPDELDDGKESDIRTKDRDSKKEDTKLDQEVPDSTKVGEQDSDEGMVQRPEKETKEDSKVGKANREKEEEQIEASEDEEIDGRKRDREPKSEETKMDREDLESTKRGEQDSDEGMVQRPEKETKEDSKVGKSIVKRRRS